MSYELLNLFVFLAVFGGVAAVLLHLSFRMRRDVHRGVDRLRKLSATAPARDAEEDGAGLGKLAQGLLARTGGILLPKQTGRDHLETRLVQAGRDGPEGMRLFLGVKLLLCILFPAAALLGCTLWGKVSRSTEVMIGTLAFGAGMVGPGLWLDQRKKKRQAILRRALPDALDLLVLCLEGGGTITSAIQRVAEDLEAAHPLLAAEWTVLQREMRMGLSAGDAVKRFGERCDLEDVRDLASVLLQSERFGAGIAKALRLHADGFRAELQQRAEETAQKASVKILFPTLLCIFPAIFIVLLGPAAFQIAEMLSRTR
jgi:tight adherence protein C